MANKRIIYNPEPNDEKWMEDFNAAIQHCMNSSYYKKRCDESGFAGKVSSFADLKTTPYLSDWEFKLTNKEHEQLLCVPKEDIHVYTISSSTTGNPSFVPRTKSDVGIFQRNFGNVTLKAAGGKVQKTFFAAPKMDFILKHTTAAHAGAKAQSYGPLVYQGVDQLFSGEKGYGDVEYLISLNKLKTIVKTLKKRKKTPVFEKSIMSFVSYCKNNQREEIKLQFGGPTISTYSFLKEVKKKGHIFEMADKISVTVDAGGWDGKKGENKTSPISKESFSKLVESIFGTKLFFDIYGTSESPTAFYGKYDFNLKDVVHSPMQATRIIVRDQFSGKILTETNDIGLLQIMTPYGSEGSPQANILTSDLVKILEVNSEGLVTKFLYVERAKSKIENQVDKGGCGDFLSKKI
jgi:hypothetical protein